MPKKCITFAAAKRGVAQSGLEYTSGGRVVAGSNPVTPTLVSKYGKVLCHSIGFPIE